MDSEQVLSAIRSLEDRRAVTASDLARVLDVDSGVVQGVLEELVASGKVCVSELRARRNEGYEFRTRSVWYHTPGREVATRFGAVLSMGEESGGERPRGGEPSPADEPVGLAS
jgi:hypothetical protein